MASPGRRDADLSTSRREVPEDAEAGVAVPISEIAALYRAKASFFGLSSQARATSYLLRALPLHRPLISRIYYYTLRAYGHRSAGGVFDSKCYRDPASQNVTCGQNESGLMGADVDTSGQDRSAPGEARFSFCVLRNRDSNVWLLHPTLKLNTSRGRRCRP